MTIYQLPATPRGFEDAAMFGGEAVQFGQFWKLHPEPNFRPGQVRFGWRPDALWLSAELDGQGSTTAQYDNQDLWTLGDVFELFIGYAEAQDYMELHVAPNGRTLQLHFPDAKAIHSLRRWHHGAPRNFVKECGWRPHISTAAHGWQVLACVPLTLKAGSQLHLACGRYDYGPGDEVISNTAPLVQPNFHRRANWHRAVLSAHTLPGRPQAVAVAGHTNNGHAVPLGMEQGALNG